MRARQLHVTTKNPCKVKEKQAICPCGQGALYSPSSAVLAMTKPVTEMLNLLKDLAYYISAQTAQQKYGMSDDKIAKVLKETSA